MMFLIDDNSSFGTGAPHQKKKDQNEVAGAKLAGGDGDQMKVQKGGPNANGGLEAPAVSRYEDAELLQKPSGFRDCPVCPLMIMVDSGSALIGSPDSEPDRRPNEGPRVAIRIAKPFTVSRYEIQRKEFAAFVDETNYAPASGCVANGELRVGASWREPGFPQTTGDHPVVCISRTDARAYANWLSAKTQRNYRLLSEGEWEYVARAGTKGPYWVGKEITTEQAYFAAEERGTQRVGQFDDNAFKLFDTAGNVWEMTADCWVDDLTAMSETGHAYNPAGICADQAVRGGGFDSPAGDLRAASRRPVSRAAAFDNVGLRLAREIK
jgi:formylglycine-generating enzyme required for sulfatase activity